MSRSSFPASLDTFTDHVDGVREPVGAEHVNKLQDAVVALEQSMAMGGASLTPRALDVTKPPYNVALDNTGNQAPGLHAARDAAIAAGVPVWIPKGVARVTQPVDFAASDLEVIGAGPGATEIRQATSDTPCVVIGGRRQKISGLAATFAVQPAVTHTSSVCWLVREASFGVYSRLLAFWSYDGWRIDQASISGNGNTFFSCTLSDIEVNGFRRSGMVLASYIGASTPLELANIYIHNNPVGTVEDALGSGLVISTFDDVRCSTINIEWCRFLSGEALLVNSAAATMDSLHIEGVELAEWGSGMVAAYGPGASLDIRGLGLQNSRFSAAAGGPHGVISTGGATTERPIHVRISGLRWLSQMPALTNPVSVHRSLDATPADVRVDATDAIPAAVVPTTSGGVDGGTP